MKRALIIIFMLLLISSSSAFADTCMRYNHHRVCPGDAAFDVISLFGEPVYKSELGEITSTLWKRNLELWIYQHKMRRWELTIANGRVLKIKKVRLRRVQ